MTNQKSGGCLKKLRKFDQFGGTLSLSLNKEESYKTVLGAFFTLAFYCLMLGALAIYVTQFFSNTNPSIQYNKLRTKEFINANLIELNMVPFLLVNTGKIYMNSSRAQQIFSFNVNKIKSSDLVSATGAITKNVTRNESVQLVPCSQSDFFVNNKKLAEHLAPESLKLIQNFGLCFKTDEITVSGGLASDQKDQLTIQVNPCIFSADNGCEPNDTARLGLANWSRITVGFIDSEYDLKNQNDPILWRFNDQTYSSLEHIKKKTMEISIKQANLDDLQGRIIPKSVESNALAVGYVFRDDRKRYDDFEPYIDILVKSSNEVEGYTRSYMNFMDLCGLLGGLFGTLSAAIFICYSVYNTLFMTKEIISSSIFQGNESDLPEKYRLKNFFKTKILSSIGLKPKRKGTRKPVIDEFSLLDMYEDLSHQVVDLSSLAKGQCESSVFSNAFLDENHKTLLPILLINLKLKELAQQELNTSKDNGVVTPVNYPTEQPTPSFTSAYEAIKNRTLNTSSEQNLVSKHIDMFFLSHIGGDDLTDSPQRTSKDSMIMNVQDCTVKRVPSSRENPTKSESEKLDPEWSLGKENEAQIVKRVPGIVATSSSHLN